MPCVSTMKPSPCVGHFANEHYQASQCHRRDLAYKMSKIKILGFNPSHNRRPEIHSSD